MIRKTALLVGVLLLAIAAPARPQEWGPPEAPTLSLGAIEQIVAPIARYPDSLLLQILMASTYPLEIVQADRWREANPRLSGDLLDEALGYHDWDPSVKSFCPFRDPMRRLNDNLDWTQDMGDAFLAQQDDVLFVVQPIRARANEAGNLRTTEYQTVAGANRTPWPPAAGSVSRQPPHSGAAPSRATVRRSKAGVQDRFRRPPVEDTGRGIASTP
jgi:hypothetical protein